MSYNKKLWAWLAGIFLISFGVLGLLGRDIYVQAPTVPERVVTGRVIGNAAALRTARVIAWHGDLVGHARDIALDPRALSGELVRVDYDGTFTIHAEPDWAIMAESQDARSAPQLVGTGAVINARLLDRIAGIDEVYEVDALDDAAVFHVEAGNDADLQHRVMPSAA